jgi:hypothetical protein
MTQTMHSYQITAWCDRTFVTTFDVRAQSPQHALAIAREQAHDEQAEECDDGYPWDTFRVADAGGAECLNWANEEAKLRCGAHALLDACRMVVDRWESSDLASAARACQSAVEQVLVNAAPSADMRTVKIEVRGGVVVDVSNLPPGWSYHIVDHDDRESASACGEA